MVKKKDSSWRLRVDYKKVNQLRFKDRFFIPIIKELLDEMGRARVFFKLALSFCYHQTRMHETNIPKTTFKTYEGH